MRSLDYATSTMKSIASKSQVVIVIFLSILLFGSSFYILSSYSSPTSCASQPSPVSVAMPAANCSCKFSYVSLPSASLFSWQSPKAPEISCNCFQPGASTQLEGQGGVANATQRECPACQACPSPQIQIVEKEVEKEVAKECPNVPWYAEDREWHFSAGFPLCTMDVCFNFTKCENMEELKVFTYDLPSPPLNNFYKINQSKYWTDDPEKACLLFVFLDTAHLWPTHPKDLPYWNEGLNHVLVTFGDRWERKGPAADSIGNASIMATIAYETSHRPGFDISIPLPARTNCSSSFSAVSIVQRKYFATFRGTRYLGKRGEGVFRSHDTFRGMHNGKDIVVATTCDHPTNNMFRKEHPESGENCDEDEETHSHYSFCDLMNTTFGLVPAGRQPNSYRFMEVLRAGAIPVLIADNYVKPFDTMIHWHICLLQFPTSQMHRIIPTLRALKEEDIIRRHENCQEFYNGFLKDDDTLQESAMRALKERFLGVLPKFAKVRRRRRQR